MRCISFDSYIKPQQRRWLIGGDYVVYLLIPTSNHNINRGRTGSCKLYIFWFLHQTTTQEPQEHLYSQLYIFWFLHQTTTVAADCRSSHRCISFDSYIKPQPSLFKSSSTHGCISFDSYIKPQQSLINIRIIRRCISFDSYIKPQLLVVVSYRLVGCISFDSYIKPQL